MTLTGWRTLALKLVADRLVSHYYMPVNIHGWYVNGVWARAPHDADLWWLWEAGLIRFPNEDQPSLALVTLTERGQREFAAAFPHTKTA